MEKFRNSESIKLEELRDLEKIETENFDFTEKNRNLSEKVENLTNESIELRNEIETLKKRNISNLDLSAHPSYNC